MLTQLNLAFRNATTPLAQRIIEERLLPSEARTIKPLPEDPNTYIHAGPHASPNAPAWCSSGGGGWGDTKRVPTSVGNTVFCILRVPAPPSPPCTFLGIVFRFVVTEDNVALMGSRENAAKVSPPQYRFTHRTSNRTTTTTTTTTPSFSTEGGGGTGHQMWHPVPCISPRIPFPSETIEGSSPPNQTSATPFSPSCRSHDPK